MTLNEKLARLKYEINGYGHYNKYELEKMYFSMKLNKAMEIYIDEIEKVSKHVLHTIQDKQIIKELHK